MKPWLFAFLLEIEMLSIQKKLFVLLKIDHNSITFLLPLQWNNSAPNMIEHVFMFLELIITYHCIKNVFQFKAESVSTIRIYLPSDGHLSYINKQINFIRRIGLLHYTYNNGKKVFLLLLIITIYNGTWQSNLVTSMTRIYILFAIFLWYSMLLIH